MCLLSLEWESLVLTLFSSEIGNMRIAVWYKTLLSTFPITTLKNIYRVNDPHLGVILICLLSLTKVSVSILLSYLAGSVYWNIISALLLWAIVGYSHTRPSSPLILAGRILPSRHFSIYQLDKLSNILLTSFSGISKHLSAGYLVIVLSRQLIVCSDEIIPLAAIIIVSRVLWITGVLFFTVQAPSTKSKWVKTLKPFLKGVEELPEV